MRKLIEFVLSSKFAGILLLLIAFAAGYATFIENDFGATTAKAVVYNARWFEIIILLTFINIAWNTYKIKPLKTKRYTVFAFHLSFLFIILGAGITRYIGYEGQMSIREGSTSNQVISDQTYLQIDLNDGAKNYHSEKSVLYSPLTKTSTRLKLKTDQGNYTLKAFEFVVNAQEFIVESAQGPSLLNLSGTIQGRFTRFSMYEGEVKTLDKYAVNFQANKTDVESFRITQKNEILYIQLPTDGNLVSMTSSESIPLIKDSLYLFEEKKVYQAGDESIMLRKYYKHAQLSVESNTSENGNGLNAVKFTLENEHGEQVESYAMGIKGYAAPAQKVTLNGKQFEIKYGSKTIELPFSLALKDFQLERYPASNSPASYASEVVLIDPRVDLKKDFRIFMNNVLDYEGFRFFQSSYDTDERGTVLSVNHDWWGMIVTYFGYGLMFLTMFLAIFEKSTRFQYLIQKRSVASFLVAFLMVPALLSGKSAQAQSSIDKLEKIPTEHLQKFSTLITQGHSGRFKPLNSVTSETFRKYSRQNEYKGLNSDQVFIGLMTNPDFWMRQDLIKVSNAELKDLIGNQNSRAAFNDFFNQSATSSYKLSKYIDESYRKNPAQRSTFDKDLITVDERVNVFYMVSTGRFLTIFPVPGKPDEPWKNPTDKLIGFPSQDSAFVKSIVGLYLDALNKAMITDQWKEADYFLDAIITYQNKYASPKIIDTQRFGLEVAYNKIDIFKQLAFVNGLLGFILLVLLFIRILWPNRRFKWSILILVSALFLAFIAHTAGLALRWYISGHAPWSNGYESMIFIGWATMLAGFSFYKRAPIALGATAILTFLILYVAHLSWMNPEITNLVPVLKSYWLTIHVAVITASYGFLALGGFLGILNLIFMILQNPKNTQRIQLKIKELSRINEATLIAGLYLLSIGTFLGGIWANESWGRYWGWDPKETWAFVTILLYAFVVHMRMIPGLRGVFALNVGSIFAYFSVLMTYFGVNYYLSGLHSYAQGDPMPIPNGVYYSVAFFVSLSILAYFANKKYEVKIN
ncbi:MAG: cytochrome c biogenesis protein CcsA [Bacteroidales bacterium]|nr:cytochrome c biogenesis protein CcsA [Bacteroidales bacterium]